MKWLIRIYLLVILALIIGGGVVEAAISSDVTITVSGAYPLAPTNFTATYVSETQVDLTWVKGANATHTLIMAKIGSYPTSITDGYQVYLGTGTNASDTGVNFEEVGGEVYYTAWGVKDVQYSIDFSRATIGGVSVTLIAIALFCMVPVGLMAVAYYFNKRAIAFTAAGFALVAGGLGFTQSATVGDIYFIVGWIGVGMAITFALLGAAISEPTTGAEEENPNLNSYAQKKKRYEDRQRAQSKATEPRSRGRLRY